MAAESPSGADEHASSGAPATAPSEPTSYTELYEQIKHKPCRVLAINKLNEEPDAPPLRTKPNLIDRELERVHAASTLEEVHQALELAGRNLQQLGVFSRVDLLVNEEPVDDPEACTVLLDLKEKNWYRAHAATYFQGAENTIEMSLGLNNPTGHAEHVAATFEIGTERSNHFSLSYDQARPWGLPLMLEARAQQYLRNHIQTSSYSEKLRGVLLALKSMDGQHALQYELGWRSLLVDVPATGASSAVHAQAGDFLKAAARYTLFLDKRNNVVNPTSGWGLRCTSEVTGLGPDQGLRYAKQQFDAQVLLPITRGVTLSLQASTGIMLPWGGAEPLSRQTCIADRFFLGGPSTLRGFKFRGVGPTDARRQEYARLEASTAGSSDASAADSAASVSARRDALGGDLYSSVLAEVTFALPAKPLRALNLFGHVFVNGGNCDLLAGTGQPIKERCRTWASSWRWSAGVGLVLPTWFGRFEANYVHVLAAQEHDRVKRGIQLGFASSVFT